MDSLDHAGYDWEETAAAPAAIVADRCSAFAEFEQRLLVRCTRTSDDEDFWTQVGHDIDLLESNLDAKERMQFETSIDCLLSRLGMTSWTIVKYSRSRR